jgi:hypothetical protein
MLVPASASSFVVAPESMATDVGLRYPIDSSQMHWHVAPSKGNGAQYYLQSVGSGSWAAKRSQQPLI